LVEEDFSTIVKEDWTDQGFNIETSIQQIFVWKLKVLKQRIKTWVKLQRKNKLFRIKNMEEELRDSYLKNEGGEGPIIRLPHNYLGGREK
jgi:hypothetical protein